MSYKNILQLNDDCLLEVFRFLDISDQLNLARACNQFEYIFKEYAKVNYKNPPNILCERLTDADLEAFVKLAGECIEQSDSKRISDLIIRMGVENARIKRLYILITDQHQVYNYRENIPKLKSVEAVHIATHCVRINDSDCVRALQQLPHLKRLVINYYMYNGEPLSGLRQLEELFIKQMDSAQIIIRYIPFQNLRTLHIDSRLTTIDLSRISLSGSRLEELSCEFDRRCEQKLIANLPKLKYLRISHSEPQQELFNALAERRANQLECLEIVVSSINHDVAECIGRIYSLRQLLFPIDDISSIQFLFSLKNLEVLEVCSPRIRSYHLLRVIHECEKLRCICITGAENVATKFVPDALNYMRQNSQRASLPLWVVGPGLKQSINAWDNSNPYIKLADYFEEVHSEYIRDLMTTLE